MRRYSWEFTAVYLNTYKSRTPKVVIYPQHPQHVPIVILMFSGIDIRPLSEA